ncbi:Hsp20/alpha crystallin family protein [Leucobacter chromiiresistens]|uniref:Heat shock protein Hsp20 n=1 Tax=Leucobacter chromiiresistens TaxID=1079994 RepID=A0A1H0Y6B9_9MICO|nr:Hsp20/alpha crystallin family protein [Leucobacter chromiiresistens]SDQ10695.1 heat shock protein Hsp20 [Leucobacter chromiiresistens]
MAMTFDPFSEMDRWAATALQQARSGPRQMPVDLQRDHERYVLNADLPGVDPGSIDIDVDGQLLTIRAQRTADVAEGSKWLTRERPSGTYLRQFSVGQGVDIAGISASYDNGVLSVVIPVSEQAKPRKIAVEGQAAHLDSADPSSERRDAQKSLTH